MTIRIELNIRIFAASCTARLRQVRLTTLLPNVLRLISEGPDCRSEGGFPQEQRSVSLKRSLIRGIESSPATERRGAACPEQRCAGQVQVEARVTCQSIFLGTHVLDTRGFRSGSGFGPQSSWGAVLIEAFDDVDSKKFRLGNAETVRDQHAARIGATHRRGTQPHLPVPA